jgi:ABC-type glycerol-3-phosphate transport system substrate-binding protein
VQPKRYSRIGLFLIFLFPGCSRDSQPAQPLPEFQGVHLRIACPSTRLELITNPIRSWARRQGGTIEVLPYAPGDSPASVGGADLWILRPARLPHWAEAKKLVPIPDTYTQTGHDYSWRDVLGLYRDRLLFWDGTLYGLPLLGESPLCCYRSDHLADRTEQQAFLRQQGRALKAPATWEDVRAIAAHFSKDGPALPPLPQEDEDLLRLFYQVVSSYTRQAVPGEQDVPKELYGEAFSSYYDLKTGQPRIDSPGNVSALSMLQQLQKYRPPGVAPHPEEAFAQDKGAVLCLTDSTWLPTFQKEPTLADRFDLAQIPGASFSFAYHTGVKVEGAEPNRVPYLGSGSWLGVVPTTSKNPEAALALLVHLSMPTTARQLASDPASGGPIRARDLNRDGWEAFHLDIRRTLQLRDIVRHTLLHRTVKNPLFVLRTPDAQEHQKILAQQVRAVLEQNLDPAQALGQVAQRWRELDAREGEKLHLQRYRVSLGLLRQ